jgi:hypothetical protein
MHTLASHMINMDEIFNAPLLMVETASKAQQRLSAKTRLELL